MYGADFIDYFVLEVVLPLETCQVYIFLLLNLSASCLKTGLITVTPLCSDGGWWSKTVCLRSFHDQQKLQ